MRFTQWPVVLAAPVLAAIAIEADAQDTCKGPRQNFDLGEESFVTTSRVYKGNGVELYVTCVENHSDKDLWINWFVPGPVTYIQPGKAVESPRAFQTRENKDYRGCLEYGSVGEYIQSPFIGHLSDDSKIESESGGCEKANPLASNAAPTKSIVPVDLPVKIYFPSDVKEPEDTMLAFEGVARTGIGSVLVTEFSETVLFSGLVYKIEHASKAQKGRPEDVRIKPFITSGYSEKYYLNAFYERYTKDGLSLREGDEIDLAFYNAAKGEAFTLSSVRWGVFDRNDHLVAAFFAPVWGPSP
jgi:hypothetical protein